MMPPSVQHLSAKAGQSEQFSPVSTVYPCAMQVTLFDVQQRTAIADLTVPFIKYIVWSSDMNHVALLSKHAIIVANKRLGQAFTGALPGTRAVLCLTCALSGRDMQLTTQSMRRHWHPEWHDWL